MLGIASLLILSPGTRSGSENDSDSTYTTVESVMFSERFSLIASASAEYFSASAFIVSSL